MTAVVVSVKNFKVRLSSDMCKVSAKPVYLHSIYSTEETIVISGAYVEKVKRNLEQRYITKFCRRLKKNQGREFPEDEKRIRRTSTSRNDVKVNSLSVIVRGDHHEYPYWQETLNVSQSRT